MRIDDVFRRCFVVVVCFLIGAAAYFQASGVMSLAGRILNADAPMLAPPTSQGGARGSEAPGWRPGAGQEKSAAAILASNPFDSKNRSLLGEPLPPGDPGPLNEGGDPYRDPFCDGARVVLITSAEDPAWSFAAIAEGAGKAILRRLGDEVLGAQVVAINDDRVWLHSRSQRCQLGLGYRKPSLGGSTQQASLTGGPASSGASSAAGAIPPDIAAGIRRVGERELEVDRSVIKTIMDKQGELLRRVRVLPEKEGDRVVGLRVMGIRPGSLLGALGLENGDRLQGVNGIEVSDPRSALDAYTRLMSADHLVVSVVRRGQPMNIDVRIKG